MVCVVMRNYEYLCQIKADDVNYMTITVYFSLSILEHGIKSKSIVPSFSALLLHVNGWRSGLCMDI